MPYEIRSKNTCKIRKILAVCHEEGHPPRWIFHLWMFPRSPRTTRLSWWPPLQLNNHPKSDPSPWLRNLVVGTSFQLRGGYGEVSWMCCGMWHNSEVWPELKLGQNMTGESVKYSWSTMYVCVMLDSLEMQCVSPTLMPVNHQDSMEKWWEKLVF